MATRIVELDRASLRSFVARYSDCLRRRDELLDAEGRAVRKFDQTLAQEERWIREGIKVRRTHSEDGARRLEAMRRERVARRKRQVVSASRSARRRHRFEAEHAADGYGDVPVIWDPSTAIMRCDCIGTGRLRRQALPGGTEQ